jgi:hypothetical protein
MTGVEILSTTEVITDFVWNYWLAGFIYIGVIIVCGLAGYLCSDRLDKFENTIIGCVVGAIIGLLIYILSAAITAKPAAYKMEYKVTISDEVSMNEFLDKYEIIEQEGKIYTVRERDK